MATNNSINLPNGTTGQLVVGVTGAGGSYASSALADFTFTSATAGATRTLTVSNTDNTNSSSTALLAVTTGGASAGDAFHTVSTTTTTWAFGVDNSITSPTADPFVISQNSTLGTNNIMSAATSGEINYPLQPAFLAYNSVTDANVTGAGADYTIICDTEIYDQNSDYNNGTGTFTAPVTGRYQFMGTVYLQQVGAAHTIVLNSLVASNRTAYSISVTGLSANANGDLVLPFSTFMDMDAADTITLHTQVFNGTATVDVGGAAGTTLLTYFGGSLVC